MLKICKTSKRRKLSKLEILEGKLVHLFCAWEMEKPLL